MWRRYLSTLLFAITVGFAPPAKAGIPVIDVAAIAQLIQQVMYWQQQIQSMSDQLNQLQQTYGTLTGERGMQGLLPISPEQRNYLPANYGELLHTIEGSSQTYAGLSSQVKAVMVANAILSNPQLASLTPEVREIVEQGRKSAAMVATLSRTAYDNTGQRFSALQQLISSIGAAGDLKAIQDLQGRVAAEQAMLTNEQTKLQTLYHMAQAEQLTQQQRIREQVMSGHGGFSNRFAPAP